MKKLNGRDDDRIRGEYPTYAQYTESGNTVYYTTDGLYTGVPQSVGNDRVIALTPVTARDRDTFAKHGILRDVLAATEGR